MTTYSFMGAEIHADLIDVVNEYVSHFLELEVPKKQYQPFLKRLIQDAPKMGDLTQQKRYIRKQAQNYVNQWERAATVNAPDVG